MEGLTAWFKVIHIVTLLFWAGTLFYLPSLLAAHADTSRRTAFFRLRALTRYTYLGVASPAAILAIISGAVLIQLADAIGGWLFLKLTTVALMVAFHVLCGSLVSALAWEPEKYASPSLTWLVVIPAVLVPVTIWLVLAKPV